MVLVVIITGGPPGDGRKRSSPCAEASWFRFLFEVSFSLLDNEEGRSASNVMTGPTAAAAGPRGDAGGGIEVEKDAAGEEGDREPAHTLGV